MFKDLKTSQSVLNELESCSKILNDSLFIAQHGECDKDSYAEYKRLVGFSMGFIYTDMVRPIHKAHPDLEPEELKNGNG